MLSAGSEELGVWLLVLILGIPLLRQEGLSEAFHI